MKSMKDIVKAIDLNSIDPDGRYAYIGIRIQDESYGLHVGQTVEHNSHVWIDGDETDTELDGVCAISTAVINFVDTMYFGDTVIVLGSDAAEYGEDLGEIIMKDAVVLDIIEI